MPSSCLVSVDQQLVDRKAGRYGLDEIHDSACVQASSARTNLQPRAHSTIAGSCLPVLF
jgi:hypothetical protein